MIKPVIDIFIVFAVSALVLYLEDLFSAQGWISIGPEARGAPAVVGGALAAIGVVFARGGTFADLGFKRPQHWKTVFYQAIAILVAFIAAQGLAPLFVASFISIPTWDLSRYDSIAGNPGAAIALALLLPLTASIPEEIIYRGFLLGRLSDIFGRNAGGTSLAILVQALVFGSVHFMWGIGGMVVAFIMGIVWGAAYILCRRNLWTVILAHSAGHMLFVIQLYLRG